MAHLCRLFSHDSIAVMADKETMQDTSVSMDTLGLDPDSTAGIQGSTSRVESTSSTMSSSSDESSSDRETGKQGNWGHAQWPNAFGSFG